MAETNKTAEKANRRKQWVQALSEFFSSGILIGISVMAGLGTGIFYYAYTGDLMQSLVTGGAICSFVTVVLLDHKTDVLRKYFGRKNKK